MTPLERTLRLSRFAARVALARPEVPRDLEERAAAPFSRQEMRAALDGASAQDIGSRLRRLRERVMFTLAHRDLNGLAPLDEVVATMTALADTCIASAVVHAHHAAAARFGKPSGVDGRRAELIVAALGKLGGEELNVSSDIDLVFLYEEEGETSGERPVSHHEFFSQVGRNLIALLSETTDEGQAFRVDMRLRPFGDGPLASSLGALEEYFVTHARPWERYAWLKARVVSGPADGVMALVEPFVYRRYLDYGLLGALRELHARIFETAVQRRKADDIKVGAGGIREIEFAVQLFQLVRGGRDRGLQLQSTRKALAALTERELIEPERARSLGEAYTFLRRLEHRLQYYDDQQTQALPRSDEHRALIAEAMDFPDWEALANALEHHRARVQEAFNALFEGEPRRTNAAAVSVVASLNDPQTTPDAQSLAEDLADAGVAEGRHAADRLIEFTRSRRYRSMSTTTRAKLEKLLAEVIAASAEAGNAPVTLERLLQVLEAIDRREAYLALLLEYPQVLARAARLVARSAWAARLIARHPILLDELTRTTASFTATDWRAERRELRAACESHGEDLERLLDELRHFKQRHVLRLTIADLEGELPVMALSDELSALADTLLEVTLDLASKTVIPDASAGGNDPGPISGFAVIGYGKLGGKELGYGSDLDIVFLYEGEQTAEHAPRIAQRVINWITTLTPAGVLYETDLRLRPDGAKGVMVSSLAGFATYQHTRAWTWEHQALTRARFCAGDPALGKRFEAIRDEIIAAPRDAAKLVADIVAMRTKMRAEQKRDANELKHVEGGVIDLEFCVQALVLLHGPAHAALRENKGNHALLQRAGDLGLLDPLLAAEAGAAYLEYRRRIHQAALNDEERVIVAGDDLAAERAAVRRLWSVVL